MFKNLLIVTCWLLFAAMPRLVLADPLKFNAAIVRLLIADAGEEFETFIWYPTRALKCHGRWGPLPLQPAGMQ